MIKDFKTYLIICFEVLTVMSWSQTQSSLSKHSIGITFEPNYGYRYLNFSSYNKFIAKERNANEVGRFGLTAGIELKRRTSNKSEFSYGVVYSRFGYDTRFKDLNFVTSNVNYPKRSKTAYFYESMGIPMSVAYHFTKWKLNFYLKGGIQTNYIFQRTARTVLEYVNHVDHSQHTATLGFQQFNVAALVGLGIQYKLNNKFSLVAEPIFRKSLTSLNADKSAKENPYSLGLFVKVFYSLKT